MGRVVLAVDAVVVGLLAVSAQVQVWSSSTGLWGGPVLHAVLALVITVPLLLRRRYPLPVLAVVAASAWLHGELGGGLGQPWFATVLALYAVAAHAVRRDAVVGAVLVAMVMAAESVPKLRAGDPWDDVVPVWFVLAGVWAFGRWMRRRRRDAHALLERAAVLDQRTAALQEERAAAARAAAASERARIARELHDLVAHSMGVVVIQSQAAQRMFDTDATASRRAMAAVESTGRQGMAELRRLLEVLTGDEDVPLDPLPSLSGLRPLLDQVRAAGLAVDLVVEGAARTLPPGVELSAYRIVQESLTNTLRHAGATTATVRLTYGAAGLDVEVTDDGVGHEGGGPGAAVPLADRPVAEGPVADGSVARSGGHGLVGMRERVSLHGGTLRAGPRAHHGGYSVHAHLPLGVGVGGA